MLLWPLQKPMSQQIFHRIAISGDPGSGKTSFAGKVAEHMGYELITTGNIFREMARERGITITELNKMAETNKEFDHKVDEFLVSLNERPGHIVLDSRMAWHFVKGAFKIRLTVDPEIAATRIFGDRAELRERFEDVETAIEDVKARRRSEIKRYYDLYQVDIADEDNFDLVIDTSGRTMSQTLEVFLSKFQKLTTAANG